MCRSNREKDLDSARGRRVVPNLHSRELFKKVNFFKYLSEDDQKTRFHWRPKGAKVNTTDELSHEQWSRKYASNEIKTSRYTWWNFLPISLFLQFTKVVNCFYVVSTILQSIPSISTNDPIYAGTVLIILILIGVIKELLADMKRYKTDKLSNAVPT